MTEVFLLCGKLAISTQRGTGLLKRQGAATKLCHFSVSHTFVIYEFVPYAFISLLVLYCPLAEH